MCYTVLKKNRTHTTHVPVVVPAVALPGHAGPRHVQQEGGVAPRHRRCSRRRRSRLLLLVHHAGDSGGMREREKKGNAFSQKLSSSSLSLSFLLPVAAHSVMEVRGYKAPHFEGDTTVRAWRHVCVCTPNNNSNNCIDITNLT